MTSQERLTTVLQGRLPDRVPISTYELLGWEEEGWYAEQPSYEGLRRLIREKADCMYLIGPGCRYGIEALLIDPDPRLCETRVWQEGQSEYTETILHTPCGLLRNLARVDGDVNTTWRLEHWLKDEEDVRRFLSLPFKPILADTSGFGPAAERIGDAGLLLISVADPLLMVSELFDFSTFLTLVFTARSCIDALMELMSERLYAYLEPVIAAWPGACYRICGPEYATPPYLPPRLFKELVVDYDRKLIGMIHRAGAYARIHCHGRIGQVLDLLAELEPDALDPIESSPDSDITLAEVKRRIGDRISLFGNIQLRDLEYRTEAEVEDLVRQAIDTAAGGGRFVLMPTSAPIISPLPAQTERNYIRFIEAGLKYGRY